MITYGADGGMPFFLADKEFFYPQTILADVACP